MNKDNSFLKHLDKLILMIQKTNDSKLIYEFYWFLDMLKNDYDNHLKHEEKLDELEKKVDLTSLKIMKRHDMMFDDQIEMRYEIKRYINSLDKKLRIVEKCMFAKPRTTGMFLILLGKKFLNSAKDYEKKSKENEI